jgi:hypothetical protein
MWFGGGELYTYAVNKNSTTQQIDKVSIDLKRYGIPQIDQKKMPLPEAPGPKSKKNEGEKPGAPVVAKSDTSAASKRILTEPPPSKKKAPAKHTQPR